MVRRLNQDDINRRLEFVIAEAAQPSPIRDQAVTFTLRVLGNFYCVGRDCQSNHIKLNSPYRSVAAHQLIESKKAPVEWLKEVTNEHQEPLKQVWNWLCASHLITPAMLEARLKQWPIVVVTAAENARLNKLHSLGPAERYTSAGIQIMRRQDDKSWMPTT